MLASLGLAALRIFLLAVAVQLCLRLMRVRNPQLLLTCWTSVLAASLAMPLLQEVTVFKLPITQTVLSFDAPTSGPQIASVGTQRRVVAMAPRQAPPVWPRVIVVIYALTCGGLLVRLLLGLGLSARIVRHSRRLSLEGVRGLSVRVSPAVNGPVTLGNTILLPTDCADWPEDKLRAVMAHEHAHAKAGDFYVLLMAQLSRAIFWFSPVSWWLHYRLTMLAEMASDDAALAEFGDRAGYARVLLDFAGQSSLGAVGVAMARTGTVEGRIERILTGSHAPQRAGLIERILVVAGVLCVALIAAASIVRVSGPQASRIVVRPARYTPVHLDPSQLDRYAGYYRDPQNGSLMIVTRAGDHLNTHRAGLPPVPEYPYTDKDFFLTTVPQQNRFVTGASGGVTGVVHHQNGRDEILDRIDDESGRHQTAMVEQRFVEERAAHIEKPIDASLLDAYAGSYMLAPDRNVTIRRHGSSLILQFDGRPAHEYQAYDTQDFFSTSAAAQISFVIGSDGKVRAFVLHEGGQDRVADRLGTDARAIPDGSISEMP